MKNGNWHIIVAALVSTLTTILGIGILGLIFFNTKIGFIERAKMLDEHGFSDEARLHLIEMVSDPLMALTQTEEDIADGLHLLGEIALKSDNSAGAITSWNSLVNRYPNSELADSVKERTEELRFEFEKKLADLASSVKAQSYFNNADVWLKSTEVHSPSPDSSFIPSDEAAFDWFNRVIEDFPETSHAELAYERMIEHRLGTVDYRMPEKKYSESNSEYRIRLEIDQLKRRLYATLAAGLAAPILEDFEKSYPDSHKLQRLRYLIGQTYWIAGDLESARLWLSRIIDADQDENTFYRDFAFRRLQNLPDLYEEK